MQDNFPCHVPNVSRSFTTMKELRFCNGSPRVQTQIDNLWKIIRGKVIAEKEMSTTTELWNKLKEEWSNIIPELCYKFVTSCGEQ